MFKSHSLALARFLPMPDLVLFLFHFQNRFYRHSRYVFFHFSFIFSSQKTSLKRPVNHMDINLCSHRASARAQWFQCVWFGLHCGNRYSFSRLQAGGTTNLHSAYVYAEPWQWETLKQDLSSIYSFINFLINGVVMCNVRWGTGSTVPSSLRDGFENENM